MLTTYEHAVQPEEAAARPAAEWQRPSVRLTLLFAALACFGLVMATSSAGSEDFIPAVAKRLVLTGMGVLAFVFGAAVNYQWWRRHHLGILILALGGLAAVLIPGVSVVRNGARRWISAGLPVGFQPSEFAKIALCIWVAAHCERNLTRMRGFVRGFLMPVGVVGSACLLILLEPDFGTAVLTGLVCITVLLVLGTRLVFVLLAAAASLPLMHQLIVGVPYRLARVLAFLNPWADPQGSGYQLTQSLIAIGSGGAGGLGLGASRQKEAFLPGVVNDFAFSVVAEELGFVGSVVLIALFALVLWECFKVTRRSRCPFGFGLALGLSVLLGVQAAAHIAVVSGCVPTKGLSLPFISAGGSSLIASMLAAGILVNIARCAEDPGRHRFRSWQEDIPVYERLAVRLLAPPAGAFAQRVRLHFRDGGHRRDA